MWCYMYEQKQLINQIVFGALTTESNSFMILRREIGGWNYHLSNLTLYLLQIANSFFFILMLILCHLDAPISHVKG